MDFSKIKKAAILFTCGVILLVAGESFASVTWLSSITDTSAPTGIAVDAKGNLYVTERYHKDRLLVFDGQGRRTRILNGLTEPSGVAVDGSFRIYVAGGKKGTKSVSVYNPDFSFSHKLGKGEGEFTNPAGIAISADGLAFVSDANDNIVRVYSPDGKFARSFGGFGGGDGKFNTPLGIAVDDGNGEIYVVDLVLTPDPTAGNALMSGARVQVFDLNGVFRRRFGKFGATPGLMGRPINIATNGSGKVYITDSYWMPNAIHVFTGTGAWIETISDTAHPLKNGLGIAAGKDGRLFATSLNGPSVEVYGTDKYTTMNVSPAQSLSFTAEEGGPDPATQFVTISNAGTAVLEWTATAATSDGGGWLAAQGSGSAGPGGTSTLSIDVKTAGLAAGVYTGTITITGPGAEEKLSVQFTLAPPPAILSVVPRELIFKSQQDGPAPLPLSFSINNLGSGNMSWTAAASEPRLVLEASSSFLTVSPRTAGLPAGTYTYPVTITAPGAQGSPADVSVTVRVIYAGTIKVNSNLADAAFAITGPASYNGTGAWSSEEVVPGDYTITFNRKAGYIKPLAKKFTVKTGQEVVVSGDYLKKPVATHVLGGSAGKDVLVSVQPIGGGEPTTFSPFKNPQTSVRVTAGDFDGSGSGMIAVTDSKKTIKVFSNQGMELASLELGDGHSSADVIAADIDKDGKTDIIVSAESEARPRRTVKVFSYAANRLEERATLFSEDAEGRFSIALGDVNDDGACELLIAEKDGIRAFAIDQPMVAGAPLWTRSGDFGAEPRIAAGDLDRDGISEIALSFAVSPAQGGKKQHTPVIKIFKGTGADYGQAIGPFKDLEVTDASTIAIADIDGDGDDELIVGSGPAPGNDPVIRIFEGDGTYAGITMKPMDGKFGVNVAAGNFR